MQGHCCYQAKSILVDMEAFVPADHFLRQVDRYVSLEFVKPMTCSYYCQGKGRPSIDPEIFFRMILVGYFYNIKSNRQLCDEVRYNLAYRLFCKIPAFKTVPHHSSLSRIRDRLGENTFEHFFLKIVELCQKKGLVNGEKLMTDATLINANASIQSMQLKSFQVLLEKGNIAKTKLSNKTHQSVTDPDTTLAFKAGTSQNLKYKNHLTIDEDHRIIVDCHITTGAKHESQDYLDRLRKIINIFNWNIKEVTADRAYGTGENLHLLKEMNIKSYIPLFNRTSGMALPE